MVLQSKRSSFLPSCPVSLLKLPKDLWSPQDPEGPPQDPVGPPRTIWSQYEIILVRKVDLIAFSTRTFFLKQEILESNSASYFEFVYSKYQLFQQIGEHIGTRHRRFRPLWYTSSAPHSRSVWRHYRSTAAPASAG